MRVAPFIALRYLRSRRKEVFISVITVISVLGVAVSVLVLDIVLAVMTGFEAELQAKLLDANAHVVVRRYGGELRNWDSLSDTIKQVPGVTEVDPFTYNQAMLSVGHGAHGVIIRGVPSRPTPLAKLSQLLDGRDAGEALFSPPAVEVQRPDGTLDEVELPALVIGKALQKRLGLSPGMAVTAIAPTFRSSPQGLVPTVRRFIITDVYSSGLMEYEATVAYAALHETQRFFGLHDSVSGLDVMVRDMFQAIELAGDIYEAVGGANSAYYVTDWTEPNKALWEAIKLEKRVYFIVLLLLILVASFSIVSTLVMVVMEKSKDIAILKSMGARSGLVLRIFFLQGVFIGVLGTILGTILGYVGCILLREYGFEIDKTVFSLETVPVRIETANFAMVALAAFIITALAGLYPALRAAWIRPAEILRFE